MKRILLTTGLLAAAIVPGTACSVVRHVTLPNLPAPTPTEAPYEPCLDIGGVVTVRYEDVLDCDLRPPQTLTMTVDQGTYEAVAPFGTALGWGGDAALAWAQGVLDDAGCTVTWVGGTIAIGADCDY